MVEHEGEGVDVTVGGGGIVAAVENGRAVVGKRIDEQRVGTVAAAQLIGQALVPVEIIIAITAVDIFKDKAAIERDFIVPRPGIHHESQAIQ